MASSDKDFDISQYIEQYIDTEPKPIYDFNKIDLDNIDINPLKKYLFKNNLEKKCKTAYTLSNRTTYEQVFAIGDIHGDLTAFETIITNIKFNDEEYCISKIEKKKRIKNKWRNNNKNANIL